MVGSAENKVNSAQLEMGLGVILSQTILLLTEYGSVQYYVSTFWGLGEGLSQNADSDDAWEGGEPHS